ncbi:MAG: hypothetical protein ABL971_01475 [Vicinamibacterales bacterium]
MKSRSARLVSWVLAAGFAAGVCASLLSIPVQVTDSLIPILQAQSAPSVTGAVVASADSAAYLRPLRIAQIQVLFEASGGDYFFVYKAFHVALVLACLALFVVAARVRTAGDVWAFACALTVLTGLHTFLGTVWEAYPINHFLEVVVLCLCVYVLAESRGGWWTDVLAALAFMVAALTLESGLLLWVVAAVAWLTGAKGISRRGIVLMTALLVGYLVLRFGYYATGLPTLVERSTGFGTMKLDPPELLRRFGDRPMMLYAYNVVSSLGSVLFSQPRAGVWTLLAEPKAQGLSPGTVMNVAVSLLTTMAIAVWSMRRWPAWRVRQFQRDDRVVLVALAVTVANAVLSYGYTKDEIMSPAGVFYALAVCVVARDLVMGPRRAWAMLLVIGIVTAGWAVRAAGLHYQMHQMAHDVRNEWVTVDAWLEAQRASPATDEARALVHQLREDALARVAGNPWGLALQGTRVFR